jgi:GntR family transcriptional regulator / MocR family aminotransferase
MHLELDGKGALYEQLTRALKRGILGGHLGGGSKLPATRDLANDLGVSRNTVLTAYELLCTEQLAMARGGSGTYVAHNMGPRTSPSASHAVGPQSRYAARTRRLGPTMLARTQPPVRYDLHCGEPLLSPALASGWRNELGKAAMHTELRYTTLQGLAALRQAICDHIARRRGVLANPDDIVIVSGTQQALSLVARVLLDDNHRAVIEDPRYELAFQTLRAHGCRIVPVRTDEDGLVTNELPTTSVRLVYVTPSHQFPSGSTMSLPRRMELLAYASERRCWILEDDYDGEFRFDSKPIPALRSLDVRDRVIYVGSFSKIVFPALRLGYVVCPKALVDDLVAAKKLDDLGCPAIEQAAMAEFIKSGRLERHLRRGTAELRRRRNCLIDGIRSHAGKHIRLIDSRAGMHLIGWLPGFTYARFAKLIELGRQRGVGLHAIHHFYSVAPETPGLILGFAGLSPIQISNATKILGACIDEV